MRLGFACIWDTNPRKTWSYTPWDLREALRRRSDVEVVDIGFSIPTVLRRALQLLSLRRRAGRWITPWKYMGIWQAGLQRELEWRATKLECDAVLQIQDLGITSVPYFIYQDLSHDIALDCLLSGSQALREYFPSYTVENLRRLRERQLKVYDGAEKLLAMSHFLRQSLIERTGIDPGKVVTVWPGLSTSGSPKLAGPSDRGNRQRGPARLLFVGTSFLVKGGDQVLGALAVLRRGLFPQMTLTVVGPDRWPLATPPPAGVSFLGRVDPAELPRIYEEHDLLVVPSRLEGFGKVFVEALSHGMPCVGRRAFAMPELIQPGVSGDLVDSDSPEDLAACITNVLGNEAIFRHCRSTSAQVAATFCWDRAAADIAAIASSSISARGGA